MARFSPLRAADLTGGEGDREQAERGEREDHPVPGELEDELAA